jgi:23S rRNA (pseudouridine1915-N3)-methyltransferase
MDEHGAEYRSIEFAAWLQKMQNTARRLIFVIGGPYGFSKDVYDRANQKISLSKMTFSHQMVRTIFTEQIERAGNKTAAFASCYIPQSRMFLISFHHPLQ